LLQGRKEFEDTKGTASRTKGGESPSPLRKRGGAEIKHDATTATCVKKKKRKSGSTSSILKLRRKKGTDGKKREVR